jgi:acyl-CoA synthetase (NDP forming)
MIASAGPEQYRACLEELAASDEVDAIIVIFIPTTPEGTSSIEPVIREAVAEGSADKTMLTVFMEAGGDARSGRKPEGPRIPVYPFPEPAARALARATRHAEWRARPEGDVVEYTDTEHQKAQDVIWEALARLGTEGGWLEAGEAEQVLAAYGIHPAASRTAVTPEEAIEAAAAIGGPVVLKVIAPSALHKSDVGGIVLGVEGDRAVREAFDTVTSAVDDASGALVQEYVGGGHEVIVGMAEDPSFGPLMAFGLGGVFVELIGDVSFRIHPLTDLDVDEMIAEVKSAKLLDGYRGGPAGDVPALKDLLLRLSQLIDELPEVAEFDLNPVKVLEPGQGVRVVDLRVRVRSVPQRWLPSRKDIPAAERRLR